MSPHVILVDQDDRAIGTATKQSAHQYGWRHRAFSIFLLHEQDGVLQMLWQKRQAHKYHCAGYWSNACCSHPFPEESLEIATSRRLQEELGVAVPLNKAGVFTYRAELENGLIEHEVDHVFFGWLTPQPIAFNPEEVSEVTWMDVNAPWPTPHTPWIKEAWEVVRNVLPQ